MTIKNMTKKDKDEYINGAIAEVKRIAKICPRLTYFEYQNESRYPYKGDQIRKRTGLTLNDVKELAGIRIRNQRGVAENNRKPEGKTTTRNCNISTCEKEFEAEGDMYSCPACTNAKGMASHGMDERSPGRLELYYKM